VERREDEPEWLPLLDFTAAGLEGNNLTGEPFAVSWQQLLDAAAEESELR
jgi:hypothetical protein